MSNYDGWLIKVGNYTIPFKYMKYDSYDVTRNTQDLDSYNDADGILRRNALSYICDKVVFNTPLGLTDESLTDLMSNIQSQYTSRIERKASVTCYVPEWDCYTTQDMYLANPDITIRHADDNNLQYDSVRMSFIGYGVKES